MCSDIFLLQGHINILNKISFTGSVKKVHLLRNFNIFLMQTPINPNFVNGNHVYMCVCERERERKNKKI